MTVFLSRLHPFGAFVAQNPGQNVRRLVSRTAVGLSLLLAGLASGLAPARAQAQADAVALNDAAQETTTMVVVDMSGSMLQLLGSQRRYEIAKSMLADVLPDVTEQSDVGLIAFGHRQDNDCRDIELFSRPGAPLDELRGYVDSLLPVNLAKTPLRDAIALAANQVPVSEQGTIVVISDGEDNCGVDVCNLVPQLKDRNLPVFLLGIDLDSPAVEKLHCLTTGTGGFLIETRSAAELPRYTDFIFRLSRLRATNSALQAQIVGLETQFNDQRLARSELENQIAVLTQRLLDGDQTEDMAALQAELVRLLDLNAEKQSRLGALDARVLLLEQDGQQAESEIAALTAEINRLHEMGEALRLRLRDAMSNQRDEAEVADLRAEIERMTVQIELLVKERSTAVLANTELESMVESLTGDNGRLTAERAELIIQLESLSLALNGLEAENASFRVEIKHLRAALEQNGAILVKLQDSAAHLEDRDAQIENLLERLATLEATNKDLSQQVEITRKALGEREVTLTKRDEMILRLRETVRSLNEVLARKNTAIEELNQSILGLEARIEALRLDHAAFEDLQMQVAELRVHITDRDSTIADLNRQLEEARSMLIVFERNAKVDSETVGDLTAQLDDVRARLVSLDAVLMERDQTIISIMDQLAAAQEEAAMAQARVMSLQSEREGLGEVIVELRQQIFVLQGRQDEWQSERDALADEHDATLASLEAARVTIDGLNLQIGENGAERDRLNQIVVDLQSRLSVTFTDYEAERAKHASSLALVESLRAELAERSSVIDGIMQQLSTSESRRSALEAQNAALRLTHGELTAEIAVRDEDISRLQLDLEALHAKLTDARLAVGDERIRSQRLMMQVEDARSSLLSLLEICHSADALETLRVAGFTELGEATRACIADYVGMHAERRQLTASLEVALSQRDAFQQELVGQDPAYEVLEARLADVLTQMSDCSAARDNLGAELARLQRVVRENNAFIDAQRSQLGDQEGYIARLVTGGADAADLDRLCAAH